jgi:hypothetical protein
MAKFSGGSELECNAVDASVHVAHRPGQSASSIIRQNHELEKLEAMKNARPTSFFREPQCSLLCPFVSVPYLMRCSVDVIMPNQRLLPTILQVENICCNSRFIRRNRRLYELSLRTVVELKRAPHSSDWESGHL